MVHDRPGTGPELTLTLAWPERLLDQADAQDLLDTWAQMLTALAAAPHGGGGHTPSDFPLIALDQAQIEELEAAAPDLTEVLPVSPLQEGLLFHALFDEQAEDVYVEQIVHTLEGPLDADLLRASWQALLDRHPTLRIGFRQLAGMPQPVQVIHGRANAALACRESVRARPGRGLGRVGPYRHRGTCPALRPRAPSAAAGPSGQARNRPAPHDDHAAPLAARRLVASGADAGAVGLLRGGRQRERAAGGGALPGLPGLAGAAGQGRRPSRVAAGARRSGGADPRRAGRPGDGHHVPRRVPQGGRRTGRRPGRPRPGPGRDPEHGGAGGVGADGGAVGRAAQCRLRGHGRRAPGGAAGHGGDAGSVPEHGPGACHLRRGAHRRQCPGHAPGPAVRAPGPPAPHPQRHSAARRSGRDLRHPARLRELPRRPGRTAHRRRADPHGQPDARVDQLRAGARCEPGRRSGPAARLPAGPVHRGGGPRPGRTAGAGPAAVRGRPDGPDQHDRAAGRVGDRPR
ncbi:hypothetical protein SFUMM280S_03529 [Streptomyces fumanus]